MLRAFLTLYIYYTADREKCIHVNLNCIVPVWLNSVTFEYDEPMANSITRPRVVSGLI